MVRNEGVKLLKNPYAWGILLVCVILNLVFFLYVDQEVYSGKEYRELWQAYLSGGNSSQEEIQRAREEKEQCSENGMEAKKELYTRYLYELNSAATYGEYREGILANARKMVLFSSFSDGSFARKNVDKTAGHFAQMEPVEITEAPSLGVEKFFSPVTAALELIFLFWAGYLLFIQENENGIRSLLYVTRYGKTRLFLAETGVHILCVAAATLVMYSSNFLILNAQYGLGDLNRSIQSVPEYRSCGNVLSVGGFLLLGTAVIMYLLASLTVVIGFLCVWGKRTIFSVLLFFGCVAVSVLCYIQIPINSALGWLKYVNPVFCLDMGEVLGKYVNLNLFGNPVSYLPAVISIYAAAACVCFLLSWRGYCRIESEGKRRILFCWRKRGRDHAADSHMNLFRYEMFKVRKGGHVGIVFVFFLVLSVFFSYQDRLIFEDEDEYYYYTYMRELAGERTDEKSAYLREEQNRFSELKKEQEKWLKEGEVEAVVQIGESLRPYRGFERVVQREEYLKENKYEAFVYEGGYLRLMDPRDRGNRMLLLFGMVVLTFSLCSVFALDKERGQEMFLTLTRRGKTPRTRRKLLCAAVLCFLSFLVVYVPQFYVFLRLYGLDGAGELFGCLQPEGWFGWFGSGLPIWCWLVCQYVFRLLFMGVFGGIVLFFSARLKNVFLTVISMSLFILTAAFFYL